MLCDLRYWQTRTHCCGHIVVSMLLHVAQTGKHLLRTRNVSDQNQKQFLCPDTKFVSPTNVARARGQTGKHPGGGGGDSHMKQTGMLVVSLRGVNFGFWSLLGCSGQSANILSRQGLF